MQAKTYAGTVARTLTLALVGICLPVSVGLSAQTATDASIGKWTLNVAKSTFNPGPPPKSQTRTFDDRGGGVVVITTEGIDAQRKPTFSSYTFKYDGKDYPVPSAADAPAGTRTTNSYKLVDPYTLEYTTKVNGKPTTTTTRTVSKDGKTLTYKDAKGQVTAVWERQ